MKKLFIIIVILFINLFQFSSTKVKNKGEHTKVQNHHLANTTEHFTSKRKSYISSDNKQNRPVVRAYVTDRKKERKTVIPDEETAFERPLDNYEDIDHEVSRRFELYPKWFSHRIPDMFGKQFAKHYFHPFRSVFNRAHISNKKQATGSRRSYPRHFSAPWIHPTFHGMPHSSGPRESFMHHPSRRIVNELPQEFVEMTPGEISALTPHVPSMNLANAIGEIVDIPDNNDDAAESMHSNSYMKDIPHDLMRHLNPMEYAPYQGHPEDNWIDYASLHHGHRHMHDRNPCYHHPCLNDGRCHFSFIEKHYSLKCACKKGFSGHYCENVPFSCHPNPCQHEGICTKTLTTYFCTCPHNYKGHNCEVESACVHNPCMNNGICMETADNYYCTCEKGFDGKTCEEKVSACLMNPCKNGGSCRNLEEEVGFQCTCPKGFGCIDCSCPTEVDLGAAITTASMMAAPTMSVCPLNACKNGGSCIKSNTGFSCNCPNGFHGYDCAIPDLCTPNPCENNGVCVQDGDENYKCICPYGFKGPDCQTPLACSAHPCMNGASCMETPEGFHCKCSLGYKGKKCTDLSPCSRNPCTHHSACHEKGSMYTCSCKTGYRGKTCRERNPCLPNPCANGICDEINGLTTCNCTQGWMGDSCDIQNLCDEHKCLNGATCVHTLEEFKCVCPEGFHGTQCELRSPCHLNPCENGGICKASGSTFICRCNTGFHGERCHLTSHCHPNPCKNDGRCFEGDEGFICECQHNFVGKYCGEQHFCHSDPCSHNAHCVETDDSYECKCPMGFYGRHCNLNICEHNPCRNGGTCLPANTEYGYACECVFPYHGHSCDDMDPCVPNPCKNAGTCQTHLQRIHDVNFHIGPQFHGTDENVISVVGPSSNETFHHHPRYDEGSNEVSFVPDERVQTHEVNHFHMTADDPKKVYEEQLYHAHVEDPDEDLDHHLTDEHNDNHDRKVFDLDHHDREALDHHHDLEYPNEHNSIRKSYESDSYKRTLKKSSHLLPITENYVLTKQNSHIKKRKQSKIPRHRGGGSKKHVRKRSRITRLDTIPKVVINIRNSERLIRRTIRDLYVCQCVEGYLGAHCQHINPCRLNPCNNGGSCIPRGDRYQCHCVTGYGGLNCDDPHPCLPNPCNHGGKCSLTKSIHGYHCDCQIGWRGYNCESTDHCAIGDPCQHGGKCVSLEDKIECRCRARFSGDLCEIDKCAECNINAFCRHGHCVCKPGFIGNGFKCKALGDICKPNPCDNHGICQAGQDGKIFSCQCQHGFVGSRCEFPNPCITHPCMHNGVCIDESNSKEKGILMLDRHDYKCFCTQEYRGKNCEEASLAACSSGPCQNNGTCFDSSSESHRKHLSHIDDYECFCERGFTGKNCEVDHFPCYSQPCMNGGTCLDAGKLPDVSFDAHGYKCNCKHGLTGRNCEVTLNGPGACHLNPCLHDGRCVDATNNNDPDLHFDYDHEFKCFCGPRYSGRVCEVPYPACYSMPCLHNGTCIDASRDITNVFDETGYHCLCMAGYEGKNCERTYAFASSEEEENTLHPTELPESELLTPTPLVVYMKPSRTPTKTVKKKRPDLFIIKQTTPIPKSRPKVMDLIKEEKLLANNPTMGKPHLQNKHIALTELYDTHAPKPQDMEYKNLNSYVDVPFQKQHTKEQLSLLSNPSPTKPIMLKEWSGEESAHDTNSNNVESDPIPDTHEQARYHPESYPVEQMNSEPGNVRTIETAATPYNAMKKNQLSGMPASIWRGFYDSMNRWYHGE